MTKQLTWIAWPGRWRLCVRRVAGVPDWLVVLVHLIRVRRCRREGHVGTPVLDGVCKHCGHIWTGAELNDHNE